MPIRDYQPRHTANFDRGLDAKEWKVEINGNRDGSGDGRGERCPCCRGTRWRNNRICDACGGTGRRNDAQNEWIRQCGLDASLDDDRRVDGDQQDANLYAGTRPG